MSDEQRERLLIAEQIERAKAEEEQDASGSGSSGSPPPPEEGLKREEGTEKVVLSLSAKPVATTTTATRPIGLKLNANPLKANPLKRPNVFKANRFQLHTLNVELFWHKTTCFAKRGGAAYFRGSGAETEEDGARSCLRITILPRSVMSCPLTTHARVYPSPTVLSSTPFLYVIPIRTDTADVSHSVFSGSVVRPGDIRTRN
jgi:hypothetical protein